ncbi:MAG: hypothetical protein RLZZ207_1990 [Bacteroidota bacterium]
MSILDCQLVELQFESICSDIDFFLRRSTCECPLFRYATKEYRLKFKEVNNGLMKKMSTVDGRQTIINCTKYQVLSTKYGL